MADPVDRRAAERLAVNAGTSCAFAGQIKEDIGPAKIRDVSLDGIGLIVSRRVEPGAVIAIILAYANVANPNQKFQKTMLVRVAHVTPVHGGFLVGGTFTEPLTYQEFTSLVM
jgi:hypothetical protein